MIGETIKDFTITAQLGRGGMGDVFVAEQRIVKTKVAIKMLQPQISAEKAHVDRFFNEAIAVSKIKHAGIVKIFDVGFHEGRAYLVMEFLEGETLSSRLRQGVPFAKALDLARQITSILDATHAAGIIHRDLKPDNVFVVADAELGERVRILDFGIAKLGDVKATAASMSMGTPAYMPPELWKDAATSGPPTDVYALGCVLFELCCGRPPFLVTAVSDACGKHLTEIPPRIRSLRPELPAALDDLIAAMLEKEQPARPTTKAIAAALTAMSTAGISATLPQGPSITAATPVTPAPIVPATAPGVVATAVGHDSALGADAAKLEAEGRWMDLVKLLGTQAAAADPVAKAALHFKIATIYQDRFANMAEAIRSYERVLVHEPEHRKALDALRALYEQRRDWEKLLELEKGELGRTSPEKRADKAVDVARLASARVSKPDIQLYWWERVLEHEPDHRQAFTELAKLYEHAARWVDLSELLRRQADAAPGNDDRVAALRKLAAIQGDQLADTHATIETLQQIVELDPRDKAAKQALVDLRADKTVSVASLGEGYRIVKRDSSGSASTTAPASPAGALDTGASRSRSMPANVTGNATRSSEAFAESRASEVESGATKSDASSDAGSTRTHSDPGSSKKSPVKALALVGVLALAGGGIFIATRGGSTESGPGSQAGGAGGAGGQGAGGAGAQRAGGAGAQGGQGADGQGAGGSQAEVGGSQTDGSRASGSNGQATAGAANGQANARAANGQETGVNAEGPAAKTTASGLTLSYRVLSKPAAGGDYRVVKPAEQLHTDDRLVFEVMVSEQAHVFLSQRPKGKPLAVLFPNAGIDITNPLPPNTWTRIPSGTRSFRLNDKDAGAETVFFVASRTPPPNLAAAIANEGKPGTKPSYAVEDQIVAVAMEKRSDCAQKTREIVLDGEGACKVKTRGIELDDDPAAKSAKRVRGASPDDIVFVPFVFQHVTKSRLDAKERQPSPPLKFDCAPGVKREIAESDVDVSVKDLRERNHLSAQEYEQRLNSQGVTIAKHRETIRLHLQMVRGCECPQGYEAIFLDDNRGPRCTRK